MNTQVKYRQRVLEALVILCFGTSQALADSSCTAMVSDFVSWTNSSSATETHVIGFTMATSAKPSRWVSYVGSQLVADGSGLKTYSPALQYFSDRGNREYGCSGLCLESQPFAANKTDKISVSISNTGMLTLVLNSWGNGTTTYNAACSNGFMYATQADAFHVLSFKKLSLSIPR